MDELNLLQLTSPATAWVEASPPLVTGRNLFDALVRCLRDGDHRQIRDASDQLARYSKFWNARLAADVYLLTTAFFASAIQAANSSPADSRTDSDRAIRVLAGREQTPWTWLTTQALLVAADRLPVPPFRRVRVPIAFRRRDPDKATKIARLGLLEVRVQEGGGGAVGHDPRDAFETICLHDFVAAITDAWNVARAGGTQYGGVWRILPWDPARFSVPAGIGVAADAERGYHDGALAGRSIGGAATRASILALRGMVEDPGVICMLGVESDGTFVSVDGVTEKVGEVAKHSDWFDTIIVSPDTRGKVPNNYTDAVTALGSSADRIRVVAV